ncbi:MAG TPA: hypothetical protein DCS11_06575 [Syntrophus sp. (in: bacteria)]|nr:hypothetical protein [Syntrophus sp. (in: bacteria)]
MKKERSVIPFQYGNRPARVIQDEAGNNWWVAADVCAILGITNPRDAISSLDDDEKGVEKADTLGGQQTMNVINESGLFALIIRSNKPEARPFRKWITAEVLPAIRRTGGYAPEASVAGTAARLASLMLDAAKAGYIDYARFKTLCWLRSLGLSQDMAGRACGLDVNTVQKVERRLKELGVAFETAPGAVRHKLENANFEKVLERASRTLMAGRARKEVADA